MKTLLHRVQGTNYGDLLMALAAAQELRRGGHSVYIQPGRLSDSIRSEHGISLAIDRAEPPRSFLRRAKFEVGYLARRSSALVTAWRESSVIPAGDGEIDAVVEICGYRYGDCWGVERAERAAAYYRKLRRSGKKIILLPKTFGPFTSSAFDQPILEIVRASHIVFARDSQSFDDLNAILSRHEPELGVRVHQGVDYTCWITPSTAVPRRPDRIAFIPTMRLVASGLMSMESYIDLCSEMLSHCRSKGFEADVIFHDADDRKLLESTFRNLDDAPPIIPEHPDPVRLKSLLGEYAFAISGRLHGVINCLNMGTPVIATTWSHKYEHAMAEYGVADLVCAPERGRESWAGMIDVLCDHKAREEVARRILEAREAVVRRAEYVRTKMLEVLGDSDPAKA